MLEQETGVRVQLDSTEPGSWPGLTHLSLKSVVFWLVMWRISVGAGSFGGITHLCVYHREPDVAEEPIHYIQF